MIQQVLRAVDKLDGIYPAVLEAETKPRPGVRHISSARVLLAATGESEYEAMINSRLSGIGKEPNFVAGPLPFGMRMGNTPIIVHNGIYYLQTIVTEILQSEYFVGRHRVADPSNFGITGKSAPNQGLPLANQVVVHTYRIENITRLEIGGKMIENKMKVKA